MDETDAKILEMLRRDAHAPNAHIGKAIGLSEAAVRKRIKNLVSRGVIKRFTIDTREESEPISALVFIAVEPKAPTDQISKQILLLENISHLYEVTGDYDICAFVTTRETAKLNKIIDQIRRMPKVKASKTDIILKVWE